MALFFGDDTLLPALEDLTLQLYTTDVLGGSVDLPRLRQLRYLCDSVVDTYEDVCLEGLVLDSLEINLSDATNMAYLCEQMSLATIRTLHINFEGEYLDIHRPMSAAMEDLNFTIENDAATVSLDFVPLDEDHPNLKRIAVHARYAHIVHDVSHTLLLRRISLDEFARKFCGTGSGGGGKVEIAHHEGVHITLTLL